MDMHSREQYLEQLREEYRHASKKQKSRLLNEARKRTRLARKVLIRKLAHPANVKEPKAKRGVVSSQIKCERELAIREWCKIVMMRMHLSGTTRRQSHAGFA